MRLLVGSFLTIIAYSRAGSIVFWRTVDGHLEKPDPLNGRISVAAGALTALAIVLVVFAGPITRYTDATAEQLHNNNAYIEILQMPMVGEDD